MEASASDVELQISDALHAYGIQHTQGFEGGSTERDAATMRRINNPRQAILVAL